MHVTMRVRTGAVSWLLIGMATDAGSGAAVQSHLPRGQATVIRIDPGKVLQVGGARP